MVMTVVMTDLSVSTKTPDVLSGLRESRRSVLKTGSGWDLTAQKLVASVVVTMVLTTVPGNCNRVSRGLIYLLYLISHLSSAEAFSSPVPLNFS